MTMNGVEARAQLLLDPIRAIADPHERLMAITTRPSTIEPLMEAHRTEAQRVPGCVSRVWLAGQVENNHLHLQVAADSVMVRGLVQLLCEIYDRLTASEIQGTDLDFVARLGLSGQLSPTRINGLQALQKRIFQWTEDPSC